jgi:hypothetical protein
VTARLSKKLLEWRRGIADGPYDEGAGTLGWAWPTGGDGTLAAGNAGK